jgi:hypothetical protein
MERLLDPKNDVVFKPLLVRCPHVLVQLLVAGEWGPADGIATIDRRPLIPPGVRFLRTRRFGRTRQGAHAVF